MKFAMCKLYPYKLIFNQQRLTEQFTKEYMQVSYEKKGTVTFMLITQKCPYVCGYGYVCVCFKSV